MAKYDVLIIGAGLAGLCCARRLVERGYSALVVEATDGVGGRISTDHYNGFLLDRGFQVLQTAYPEAQRLLDYATLDLRSFYPGALTRFDGRFHRIADPWRRPWDAMKTVFSSVGSLSDKLKVAQLRHRVLSCSLEELYTRPETTTIKALRHQGFSERIIERFFRPFLAGVFFDPELGVSSRAFEFVFWAFAAGDTALPARGMGAIPQQLLRQLPVESIRTQAKVRSIDEQTVVLTGGERIKARIIVVATDGLEAARLLNVPEHGGVRGTGCLYFAAPEAPLKEPVLVLNGESVEPINSVVIPSNLSPAYAPTGQALITVNVLGVTSQDEKELLHSVRAQLEQWFGNDVRSWEHLRTYRIHRGLPLQTPPVEFPSMIRTRVKSWLFVCGDFHNAASIQWAMVSGKRAAEDAIEALHA